MTRTRRNLTILLTLLVGAVMLWQIRGHDTPAGQPPLTTVDASGLASARRAFDAAPDAMRLILLLSPT
jgi:hypothetical protein